MLAHNITTLKRHSVTTYKIAVVKVHTHFISALEWSASQPAIFTHCTHSIGFWIGPQYRSGRGGEERHLYFFLP
jgi:hypothetical protein